MQLVWGEDCSVSRVCLEWRVWHFPPTPPHELLFPYSPSSLFWGGCEITRARSHSPLSLSLPGRMSWWHTLPHPSSGWVGLCGGGLHTHSVRVDPDKGRTGTRTRVPDEGACHSVRVDPDKGRTGTRTRVSRGPGQGSPTRVHIVCQTEGSGPCKSPNLSLSVIGLRGYSIQPSLSLR